MYDLNYWMQLLFVCFFVSNRGQWQPDVLLRAGLPFVRFYPSAVHSILATFKNIEKYSLLIYRVQLFLL